MRHLLPILLLLTSCGGGDMSDTITVKRYEDASGNPVPATHNLGFAYGPLQGEGFYILVNEAALRFDPDEDKIVRVIMHEFAQVFILEDKVDPMLGPGAYSWDADTLPPYTEMTMDEAMWFARHAPKRITVKDNWLADPVSDAVDRINYACGFWADSPVLERR